MCVQYFYMIVEVIEFKSKHSVTESFSDTEYLSHIVRPYYIRKVRKSEIAPEGDFFT